MMSAILSTLGNFFIFLWIFLQIAHSSYLLCLMWQSHLSLLNLNHHHETTSVFEPCSLGTSTWYSLGLLP